MIIEATGLTKEFARARGGKRLFMAVHPLDIGLEGSQLTAVAGHSGSGKSTLLNMARRHPHTHGGKRAN